MVRVDGCVWQRNTVGFKLERLPRKLLAGSSCYIPVETVFLEEQRAAWVLTSSSSAANLEWHRKEL